MAKTQVNTPPPETTTVPPASETPAAVPQQPTNQPAAPSAIPLDGTVDILKDEDLMKAQNPEKGYNPMEIERIDKDYGQPPQTGARVAEPVTKPLGSLTANPNSTANSQVPANPADPAASPINDEQRQQGATMLVDTGLSVYQKVWELPKMLIKVEPDQVMRWCMEGKLSEQMVVPYMVEEGQQTEVPLGVFYDNLNKAVEEAATIKDSDFAKVRPPMIRLCTKKGWGMSDEAYIIGWFAQDFALRTANMISIARSIKLNTAVLMENWKMLKEQVAKGQHQAHVPAEPAPAPAQAQQATAPQLAEKKKEPPVVVPEEIPIPEGFREVEKDEVLPNGFDTHMNYQGTGKNITNAPKKEKK